MRTKTATMMLSIITCQKMEAGTLIQGYAYCSYQEKQQTAKSKERIDKLAAAQTAVNPFFNAIYCFSSMSKHAPHSSSSLPPSSNMTIFRLHSRCFLLIGNDSSSTSNSIKRKHVWKIGIILQDFRCAYLSSRVLLSRKQKSDIAENLPIDKHRGFDSGDCSVCLERLKKRKVTLKQCEATA